MKTNKWTSDQSKKLNRNFMEKLNAGLVSIGYHAATNAVLGSPKHGRMGGALPHAAGCTTMERKVLERMDRGEGRWIELRIQFRRLHIDRSLHPCIRAGGCATPTGFAARAGR